MFRITFVLLSICFLFPAYGQKNRVIRLSIFSKQAEAIFKSSDPTVKRGGNGLILAPEFVEKGCRDITLEPTVPFGYKGEVKWNQKLYEQFGDKTLSYAVKISVFDDTDTDPFFEGSIKGDTTTLISGFVTKGGDPLSISLGDQIVTPFIDSELNKEGYDKAIVTPAVIVSLCK